MGFTHYLNHKIASKKLIAKLVQAGRTQEEAKEFTNKMSESNEEQVARDFYRSKITIKDESTGEEQVYEQGNKHFNDSASTLEVLEDIAGKNQIMLDYLKKYAHQGGFLNAAENLIVFFYQTGKEMIVLDVKEHIATFTKHEDGSVSFQEKFSVTNIKTVDGLDYTPSNGESIFDVTADSKIMADGVTHIFEDIKIEAKDPVAKQIFEQPSKSSHPFAKLISWLKDKLTSLFGSPVTIPKQSKKL